jgi:hypothetical protein
MRMRTVFIILLILVLLIGFGPALLAVGSQGGRGGLRLPGRYRPRDSFALSIWYSYLTLPIGVALLGVRAVAALITFIVSWRKNASKSAKA